MGGEIGVESKVGEGSTFHFTASFDVPYVNRQAGGSVAPARSEHAAPRDGAAPGAPVDDESDRIEPKRILLVEDSDGEPGGWRSTMLERRRATRSPSQCNGQAGGGVRRETEWLRRRC